MPSYTAYMRQVMDADDNITWITMNGNHIPIKEGQTKEEAVKEFLAKKGKSGEGSAKHGSGKYDPEFETVRKNAKANSSLYGGRYTQKSKAEAYKEYKKDTQSKGEGSAKHGSGEYKAKSEKKDPFATKSKENYKNEIINGQTHFTYTDPDGLNFRVWESSNDPGWKATNRETELFNTKEEAINAAKATLKEDKLKYGDFTNKRNKDFLYKRYKKDFPESEPEMGDPHEAQRLSSIEKPKKQKWGDLRASFGSHYDKLYNDHDLDDKSDYLLDDWDKHIQNPEFKKIVQEFVQERGDFISSDREVKAFMLAAKEKGLIPQENKPAKKKETIADVFEKYKSTSINNHEEWDTNYEKMQKAINKEYTVENVQNWTAYREGISFGGSDYGEYGTNAKITVSKNLKDLLLSLPEHKQKDLIEFIRVHSGRPYSSEHIDPYEFMKALKNGKEDNGKTTVNIKTITHGWFDD